MSRYSWITNGGVANWFFVLAVTDPSAKPHKRLSGFIVDGDSAGITVDPKLINMGQRCSDTRLINFENVRVPKANLLGAEGDGFKARVRNRAMCWKAGLTMLRQTDCDEGV